MKFINSVISVLLISAGATPATANYYANPTLGVKTNIGSAPNPTPHDIRTNSVPQMTQRNQPTRNVASTAAPVPQS
jgi:hypothetical protein